VFGITSIDSIIFFKGSFTSISISVFKHIK